MAVAQYYMPGTNGGIVYLGPQIRQERANYYRYDLNKDAKLKRAEFLQAAMAMTAELDEVALKAKADKLMRRDTNGDGYLTMSEYMMPVVTDQRYIQFYAYDMDADNELSAEEILYALFLKGYEKADAGQRVKMLMKKHDRDANKAISLQEWMMVPANQPVSIPRPVPPPGRARIMGRAVSPQPTNRIMMGRAVSPQPTNRMAVSPQPIMVGAPSTQIMRGRRSPIPTAVLPAAVPQAVMRRPRSVSPVARLAMPSPQLQYQQPQFQQAQFQQAQFQPQYQQAQYQQPQFQQYRF